MESVTKDYLESELAKIFQEEIAKEIEKNGSQTWAEICGNEPQKPLTIQDIYKAMELIKNES